MYAEDGPDSEADLFAWAAAGGCEKWSETQHASQQLLDAGMIMFTPCQVMLPSIALHLLKFYIVCVNLLRFVFIVFVASKARGLIQK